MTGSRSADLRSFGNYYCHGVVFIAAKKQKRFGWAIAATFGLFCDIRSLPDGYAPVPERDRSEHFPYRKYHDAHRGVADDSGKIKGKMGPLRFELRTSAMSRRRHSQLDHDPDASTGN